MQEHGRDDEESRVEISRRRTENAYIRARYVEYTDRVITVASEIGDCISRHGFAAVAKSLAGYRSESKFY